MELPEEMRMNKRSWWEITPAEIESEITNNNFEAALDLARRRRDGLQRFMQEQEEVETESPTEEYADAVDSLDEVLQMITEIEKLYPEQDE